LRAVIFANGWLGQPPILLPDDLILAADGGALHCLKRGIRPAAVIGDLDSLTPVHLTALKALGAEIVQYPTRKDFTDLELALTYARQRGYQQIVLAAALGERWDQTLANLLLPAALPELNIRLVDGPQEIFLIYAGQPAELSGQPGDTVSLVPIGGDAQAVTTDGLEYPLHSERLPLGGTRGVSNVMERTCARVSLESGMLMCVIIHHARMPERKD